MEFEYDSAESLTNAYKHGIDFDAAKEIWLDADRVEILARVVGEARWMVIGRIGVRCCSAVILYRVGKVRLISVTRSRPEEVAIYEG